MIASLRNVAEVHLEAARGCNLLCGYCYEARKPGDAPLLMGLGVALDALELVLGNTSCKRIEVVFHGGEPLLQSAIWLESVALHALRVAARHDKGIRLAMQSNCTLLDDKQLDVLSRFDVRVGISLDGDTEINDAMRGQAEAVHRNMARFKQAGVSSGVLCVLGEHNAGHIFRIFNHFKSLGISRVSTTLRRAVGRGANLTALTADTIYEGHLEIFRFLQKGGGNALLEKTIAGKISRFLNPPTTEDFRNDLICSHPICGGGITNIYCDTAGNLFPCGLCVQRDDLVLGNLNFLDTKHHIDIVSKMYERMSDRRKRCNNCEASRICSFGCPAMDPLDEKTAEAECQANIRLFRFFKSCDRQILAEVAKGQEEVRDGSSN